MPRSLCSLRLTACAAVALVGLHATTPGRAQVQVPGGGFTSPNVEWIRNVPVTGGALTGRYYRGFLYIVTPLALEIYDATEPDAPQLVGEMARRPNAAPLYELLAHTVYTKPPDIDGDTLLLSSSPDGVTGGTDLDVVDVADPAHPRVVGTLHVPEDGRHFACVLGCSWAYGKGGEIVDLRDPSQPRLVGTWDDGLDFLLDAFQVDEVARGRVLTASQPMYILDARNPVAPKVIARSDGSPQSHGSVAWPSNGRSRLLLTRSVSLLPPRCEIRNSLQGTTFESALKTWDARGWRKIGIISGVDEYYVQNGTYTDGDPAVSGALFLTSGCGSGLFDMHPGFEDHGLVAFATYGHGTKLLSIDRSGSIAEAGYFLPYEPHDTVAAFWASNDIVYSVDIARGIDVLRVKDAATR